ncbi:SH3 domain-containing kinase-binding protein 1 [Solea solea]|uniref:SH3 domain-containing kinase-binding protein 1 n=1 Tax=Solea solea TaxID=90069 RepID=UPI00272B1C3C|nr:SH3 domain-containing kinase-binding protein 1 [Solea solea]XP_058483157.1 SH3 domain-containing kinase-binding protein 1 [Solea solea]XP_058483158.1 SH3 domain-containing kinase-binding protein 1 [Solea solea]
MGSHSSVLIPDTEEFGSIVSERLNEQIAHAGDERLQSELQTLIRLMMEKERKETQSQAVDTLTLQKNRPETSQNGCGLSAAESDATPSFSSLLPKALSSVLHPTLPSGFKPADLTLERQSSRNPENSKLERLQTELRELREQFEQMKTQHNKEIKLLMNELDEEKRIRLTLQMEIQRMKKHMSK